MAERLAQRGHAVTLLTVSPTLRWYATWRTENGVRIGEMPNLAQDNSGEGYGPLDNLLRITHATRRSYDVIHMFDHKPNASFAGSPGRLRGAVLIADWADWWGGSGGINDVPKRRFPIVGKFETWWEEQQKRWADGVVTISTVLQQRALENGCSSEHVIYIPTGAPTDRITPLRVDAAREQVGAPRGHPIVGFIGYGQGDLEIVMAALQSLPGVRLMIIGPEAPHIRAMAERFGLGDRLWQTGRKLGKEVGIYLACADVMVMPMTDTAANRGRLPNKVLDYLAAGRPMVASPVGDVKTIVERYQVGLLAKPHQFAESIDRLLHNPELRQEMGIAARRAAETTYDWNHLINQLEDFYVHILQMKRKKLSR